MSTYLKKSQHPDRKGAGVNPYGQPDRRIPNFFTPSLITTKKAKKHFFARRKVVLFFDFTNDGSPQPQTDNKV